jgi:hypothetical protein
MKAILITALALSACASPAAYAASNDDVMARLAALEKENAAIRKENAALRENKALRAQNAALKSSPGPVAISAPNAKRDAYSAYATDLPTAYKASPVETAGQLRLWGEGGAIWSGGDVTTSPYNLSNLLGSNTAGAFDLAPKLGWQAAAGFDYRFAGSPWHVSAQFRYGESGRFSGTAAVGGVLDPALIPLLGGPIAGGSASDTLTIGYKETHWLVDGAVGYDVLGSGRNAMQVKLGLRIAEVAGKTDSLQSNALSVNFNAPFDILGTGILVNSFGTTTTNAITTRSSFLGAGPRIGVEGSAPLGGGWALDYAGDAAVLFGRQRLVSTTVNTIVSDPAIIAAIIGGGGSTVNTSTDQRYATVFNADLQVGVSYWLTDQVKLSASYRLDAYFNVLNQTFSTTSNQTIDRYVHGPRLGVSATF